MGAGRCRLFPYLSIERKKYTFLLRMLSMYLTFTDLHLQFRALSPTGRGWKKVPVGAGRLQTLYIERKIFYFFSPYVKTVFEWHRPAPPSFRAFLPFFGATRCRSTPVVYKPFYREKKYTFFTPCVKYVFDRLTPAHLPPTGRGWKKVPVGAGRLQTFL